MGRDGGDFAHARVDAGVESTFVAAQRSMTAAKTVVPARRSDVLTVESDGTPMETVSKV